MKPTNRHFHRNLKAATLALAIFFTVTIVSAPTAHAQSFQILHTFSGAGDGAIPSGALALGAKGKLYGGNDEGGSGNGLIFNLTPSGSGWIFYVLNNLRAGGVQSSLVFGPVGALYGAASTGGMGGCDEGGGCGLVFKLQPPASFCKSFNCYWQETVLYRFTGGADGGNPSSPVIFDQAGNIYGTTTFGGTGSCNAGSGCGVVYELSPSGGGWSQTVLHEFNATSDGIEPSGNLALDKSGNLYGEAQGGDSDNGVLWELTSNQGVWTETVLHRFEVGQGTFPCGGLSTDSSGNIYGVTDGDGGGDSSGVAFELSPPGTWTYNVLARFPGDSIPCGPANFDTAGNFYATTFQGGQYGYGSLFKFALSNGTWTATDLHDFQLSDGIDSEGGVTVDAGGNIFGTSSQGGSFFTVCDFGCGTAWEVSP